MARYMRNPRFPLVNSSRFYEAMPVFRHPVNPGETLKKLRFMFKMQSMPLRPAVAGAYVDVWFFYVPMRAVWSSWPEFVMHNPGEGTQPAIPTLPLDQAKYFDGGTDRPALFARCYQAIANRFFRTEMDAKVPETIPQNDGVSYGFWNAPNCDFTVECMYTSGAHDFDRTVPVVNDEFSIRALRDESALLTHDQRMADNTGHYADYLRLFGVNARPNMIVEPEPLGHYRKFIQPSRMPNDQTGFTVQSYFHEGDFTLSKPRFFPEHGYVIGIATVRPKEYVRRHGAFESMWDKPSEWPLKGKPDLLDQQYGDWGAVVSPSNREYTSDAFMKYGQQLVGNVGPLIDLGAPEGTQNLNFVHVSFDPKSSLYWRFPLPDQFNSMLAPLPDGSSATGASWIGSGNHYQLDGVCSLSVATPLRLTIPDHQTAASEPNVPGAPSGS